MSNNGDVANVLKTSVARFVKMGSSSIPQLLGSNEALPTMHELQIDFPGFTSGRRVSLSLIPAPQNVDQLNFQTLTTDYWYSIQPSGAWMVNIKTPTPQAQENNAVCEFVFDGCGCDGFCCSLSPPSQKKNNTASLSMMPGLSKVATHRGTLASGRSSFTNNTIWSLLFDLQLQFSVWQRSQLLNKTQKQQWLGIYYTFRLAVSGSMSYHMSMLLFKNSTIKIFRTFKDNHDFTQI